MIWSQDDLIFPTHAVPAAGPLPEGAERVSTDTPDGNRLHGIHIRPASAGQQARTLVVGFGGNAWNAEHAAAALHEIYPEAHVIGFHYRGYRPSTGSPSAAALIDDAPLVLDLAIDRVRPERIVAVGLSIGSAVAASLGNRSGVDGVILVTPFDSLKAVAAQLYPWLPVGLLFKHELHTVELLGTAQVPVAIVAAERDEIIPTERTDALRAAVPNLVYDRTIERAGHNDVHHGPEFHAVMRQALDAVLNKDDVRSATASGNGGA